MTHSPIYGPGKGPNNVLLSMLIWKCNIVLLSKKALLMLHDVQKIFFFGPAHLLIQLQPLSLILLCVYYPFCRQMHVHRLTSHGNYSDSWSDTSVFLQSCWFITALTRSNVYPSLSTHSDCGVHSSCGQPINASI